MDYEEKLKKFIKSNKLEAEHITCKESCHSVAEAAKAVDASSDDFVKNVCMADAEANLIVAIVRGKDRASTTKVAKILGIERPELASPEQVLKKSGYPIGGIPSFGYEAVFLVDRKVLEKSQVYSGGGSDHSLVKVAPEEIVRINNARIVDIRKT